MNVRCFMFGAAVAFVFAGFVVPRAAEAQGEPSLTLSNWRALDDGSRLKISRYLLDKMKENRPDMFRSGRVEYADIKSCIDVLAQTTGMDTTFITDAAGLCVLQMLKGS